MANVSMMTDDKSKTFQKQMFEISKLNDNSRN